MKVLFIAPSWNATVADILFLFPIALPMWMLYNNHIFLWVSLASFQLETPKYSAQKLASALVRNLSPVSSQTGIRLPCTCHLVIVVRLSGSAPVPRPSYSDMHFIIAFPCFTHLLKGEFMLTHPILCGHLSSSCQDKLVFQLVLHILS